MVVTSFLARAAATALVALTVGCSSSSSPSTASTSDASVADTSTGTDASPDVAEAAAPEASTLDAAGIVAARPYTVHVPTGYDATQPTPLVVMFHGYGASGDIEEAYFDITPASDGHTFLYAYGDGTLDPTGNRFWNATNACCDAYGIAVDDVQYFDAIVQDLESKYNVDKKRIFVIGHSNGGFMSHRLACDRASTVASILSLAGAQWLDLTKCSPSEPVAVAEVHGNADQTIAYDGGTTTYMVDGGTLPEGTYPGAPTTVADWAQKNGCTGTLAATGQTYTVDTSLPPNQTIVSAYGGCPAGIDVQLWTVQGGGHIPSLNRPAWGEMVWGFLSSHPKP